MTIISIADRESRDEVAFIATRLAVHDAKIYAFKLAKDLGFDDLLRFRIWAGTEAAYKKYLLKEER